MNAPPNIQQLGRALLVQGQALPDLAYPARLGLRFPSQRDGFKGSIGQEVHDLTIVTSGDVAVASMLTRASGTPEERIRG